MRRTTRSLSSNPHPWKPSSNPFTASRSERHRARLHPLTPRHRRGDIRRRGPSGTRSSGVKRSTRPRSHSLSQRTAPQRSMTAAFQRDREPRESRVEPHPAAVDEVPRLGEPGVPLHIVGPREAVAVEKDEVRLIGRGGGTVPDRGQPIPPVLLPDVPQLEAGFLRVPLDEFARVRAGTVVRHDDLEPAVRLFGETPQDRVEGVGPLVGRDDDRDAGAAARLHVTYPARSMTGPNAASMRAASAGSISSFQPSACPRRMNRPSPRARPA